MRAFLQFRFTQAAVLTQLTQAAVFTAALSLACAPRERSNQEDSGGSAGGSSDQGDSGGSGGNSLDQGDSGGSGGDSSQGGSTGTGSGGDGGNGSGSLNLPSTPGWQVDRSLQSGGQARYFDFYFPADIAPQPALVLAFHGGTRSKADFHDGATPQAAWADVAAEKGFVLIAPNGMNEEGEPNSESAHWNDCRGDNTSTADDVQFARDLISWAHETLGIDRDRVFTSGGSNGGMMSYRLLLEAGNEITAAAAFIANLPDPDVETECEPIDVPVPLMIANGDEDPIMLWEGGELPFGAGGTVLSALETRDWFRQYNGADTEAGAGDYDNEHLYDGSTVSWTLFEPADTSGAAVRFLRVKGGGHVIPSQDYQTTLLVEAYLGWQNHDIEGAREAWSFFENF